MYERPGRALYVTATKAVQHGAPATENGLTGIAVKRTARPWSDGYDATLTPQIGIGEKFTLRPKGQCQVASGGGLAGATKGASVWIHVADNTLHLDGSAATGDIAFGRVTELTTDGRGVPTGFLRIDQDLKDSIDPTLHA